MKLTEFMSLKPHFTFKFNSYKEDSCMIKYKQKHKFTPIQIKQS